VPGIRVGVAGVGYLGSHHARILHQLRHAELVGVVDIDTAKAARIAKRYSCEAFASCEELAEAVDAVVVATPTRTHLDVARVFLEMGKAVLVEKPIAHTLAAGREMVQVARSTGARLQVGHSERFNPAFVAIKDQLHSPRFVESHRLTKFGTRGLEVDVILELMIHDIDIVASVIPEAPAGVSAVGIPVVSETIDIANARLEFPSGAVANLVASRVSISPMRKIRFFQKDNYISVNLLSHDVRMYRKLRRAGAGRGLAGEPKNLLKRVSVKVRRGEPLRAELMAFLSSAALGTEPQVTGEDGLRALEWAVAIKQSVQKNLALYAGSKDL